MFMPVCLGWSCMPGWSFSRRRVDRSGFTPRRRRGRAFNRSAAGFGECVWYLPTGTVGKYKYEAWWGEGVWLGIRMESMRAEGQGFSQES